MYGPTERWPRRSGSRARAVASLPESPVSRDTRYAPGRSWSVARRRCGMAAAYVMLMWVPAAGRRGGFGGPGDVGAMRAMTTRSERREAGRGGRRVLAVDGGGSAIRIAVDGEVAVEVDAVRRGRGAIERTAGAVTEGWRRIGSPSVDRVVLGLTTAPADSIHAD